MDLILEREMASRLGAQVEKITKRAGFDPETVAAGCLHIAVDRLVLHWDAKR